LNYLVIVRIVRKVRRMSELKPCPFCGGEAHLHIHDRYGVECDVCGMGLGCIMPTKEQAIEAWNRRADNDR
jgi:Lar family restriction alleviation protein